mmetsp:Transcript_36015/g.80163  ORF Transcript_36015/g.80163 Transcript_36015/m.80163 type:complete len:299 (+) Transcript_36015:3-899(+)
MTNQGKEEVLELPPPPPGLAGSSTAGGKNFHADVSNANGYLCHVNVECTWHGVGPEAVFNIFTFPNNAPLFRDIKCVGGRKVKSSAPGSKHIEVEQVGELKILWFTRRYSTWLDVHEDSRDPENLIITFDLIRSDVLGRFSGRWDLTPIRDPGTGEVRGCKGVLQQDVLPKGMPTFLKHVPLLGGALRGVSLRAIQRVIEDCNAAIEKIAAGQRQGKSTRQVLLELCGAPEPEEADGNGPVASFAVDMSDEEEDGDGDGGQEAEDPEPLPQSGPDKLVLTQLDCTPDGGVQLQLLTSS